MKLFTQQVVSVGKITPQNVQFLGTGFFVSESMVVTTWPKDQLESQYLMYFESSTKLSLMNKPPVVIIKDIC